MSSRRRIAWLIGPLAAMTLGVGCTSTRGPRFKAAEGTQSVAMVGEQAEPVTVGVPGSEIVADAARPGPRRDPDTRISGRVVDESGEPVAGALVRLADGSSKGGRDNQVRTDAAGGFTLSNLRPKARYNLIAEQDGGKRGPAQVGRVEASSSETGTRIVLGGDPEVIDDPDADAAPRRTRVKPISNRQAQTGDDAEPPADEAQDPAVDDPGPADRSARSAGSTWRKKPDPNGPADDDGDEANPLPPAIETRPRPRSSAEASPTRRKPSAGRSTRPAPAPDRGEADDEDLPAEPAPRKSNRSARPRPSGSDLPANEPPEMPNFGANPSGNGEYRPFAGQGDTEPAPALPSFPEGSLIPGSGHPDGGRGDSASLESSEQAAPASSGSPAQAVFASNPPEPAPASTLPRPQPAAPADASTASTGQDDYNPFALISATEEPEAPGPARKPDAPAGRPKAPSVATADPNLNAVGAEEIVDRPVGAETDLAASSRPPERPALAPSATDGAPGGSTRPEVLAAGTSPTPSAPPQPQPTPRPNRPGFFFAHRSRAVKAAAVAEVAETCEFNDATHRLVDFQLPDLEGNAVRFRDLDADFVLLDFWGTWCAPCVAPGKDQMIPHLVEIQKKYGGDRLKVAGIACESKVGEARRVAVDQVARDLGINYTLLLSSRDGSSPVQNNFQVRVYPTMILVDREGRILWSAEGSTPTSLYRLDKALAEAFKAKPAVAAKR